MDWEIKAESAKRMLDKYGASMSVLRSIPSSYSATADSYSSATSTFTTIGVITNPVVQVSPGEYSRSNSLRLILAASGLPTLDTIKYKIVCGSETWFPEKTRAVKPGGIPVIYLIDLK